jgi:hypothetical protein
MMLIRRSFDASEINPILNDSSVFESIKLPGIAAGDMDVTEFVSNPLNVLLMAEGGGIIFVQPKVGNNEPSGGIYDVHTSFLENHRGSHAIRASREAYRWMFTHTDCMILQTRVPSFNKAAATFCRMVGATLEFTRKNAWPTEPPADMSYWSLKYEDWVRNASCLIASGRAFHTHLDEEFARHKALHDNHPDEECHDRYVGACAEMIYGGQPEKAVVLYNRWARFAGYGTIAMVSRSPLLIDIGSALLMIENDNYRVIQCRSPR